MESIKKVFMSGIVTVLAMTPLISFGNGNWTPGTVTLSQNPNGGSIVQGAFSVRYNPNVTKGYISASVSPGASASFFGQDSSTGNSFICSINGQNPALLATVEKLFPAMGNGSVLTIYFDSYSRCTSVGLMNSSYSQN